MAAAVATRALRGTALAPGRAAGPLLRLEARASDATAARADLGAAIGLAAGRLRHLAASQAGAAKEVLEAQALLAEDPQLREAVQSRAGAGEPLPAAVIGAAEAAAARIEDLPDPLLRSRAADVREAGRQIAAALTGSVSPLQDLREPVVVVAHELSAADLVGAPAGRLLALAVELGGPLAHLAVVARELGIPSVAIPGVLAATAGASWGEVDGDSGELSLLDRAPRRRPHRARPPAVLPTTPVPLLANVSSPAGARKAVQAGAAGVGLLRTEMLFLGRDAPPGEEEQLAFYSGVCSIFPDRTVVIRTLDAGSDKPLAFLGRAPEPNPALGRRGLRLWLEEPSIAEPQARALVRAAASHPNLQVMFPMVGAPEEAEDARARMRSAAAASGGRVPPLGMMIELPAAAVALDAFAGLVDFVSLGTNDLTQYALGNDRELAWGAELSEFSPGVVRLLGRALAGARELRLPAGVCGELAGEPAGAVLLAGLGATSLSMSSDRLPAVAARLHEVGAEGCARRAAAALRGRRAAEVRRALAL